MQIKIKEGKFLNVYFESELFWLIKEGNLWKEPTYCLLSLIGKFLMIGIISIIDIIFLPIELLASIKYDVDNTLELISKSKDKLRGLYD